MSELEPGVPQVFMLKRFHLRLGALAIVLFTLAPVLSVVGTALDEPPPRRLLLLQAIFVVGYSFPLSLNDRAGSCSCTLSKDCFLATLG